MYYLCSLHIPEVNHSILEMDEDHPKFQTSSIESDQISSIKSERRVLIAVELREDVPAEHAEGLVAGRCAIPHRRHLRVFRLRSRIRAAKNKISPLASGGISATSTGTTVSIATC